MKMEMDNLSGTARVVIAMIVLAISGTSVSAATWKIEAEKAGDGDVEKLFPDWHPGLLKVEKAADASEGTFLGGNAGGESHPILTTIPHAGTYRIWVRHYHTAGKFSSFCVLFRDEIGEIVGSQNVDFKPVLMTAHPGKAEPSAPQTVQPVFVWSSYAVTFEQPMKGTVSFAPALGVTDGKLGIDCVIISDDRSFDPQKSDWEKLPTDSGPLQALKSPAGMKPAPVFTAHSSFFAGVSDVDQQFKLGILNASIGYRDYAWLVQLGDNFDHGWQNGSTNYGVYTAVTPDNGNAFNKPVLELAAKVPSPTGRYVGAQGNVGDFSRSYLPYRQAWREGVSKALPIYKDLDDVKDYIICGEGGGAFDYGDAARDAFHQWLARRFGGIGKLNELWRTQYKSFDEIMLPKPPGETNNKAAWFAFREFSGLEMVNQLAERAKTIRDFDTQHRHSMSQASILMINSTVFTSGAILDFEDLVNIGFAGEPEFGMDSYSMADSFCGCDVDFLLSLTKDHRLVNNEFNVHSHDPRDMARAYWSQIGKGLKGINTWALQSTPNDWIYVMWGLLNNDNTPRDKLGPIADANHEVRHLERILAPSKPMPFVKPVALYYSRLDLSLPQPTFGIYSTAFDSPYRIYAVLRGLGYPVRWVTPRQIEAGELKDIGAVVMVGVKYVPGAAATKLAQWVQQGGSLIGDQWPGVLDEYDRPQTTLLDVFGIRPEETVPTGDKAKAQQAFEQATTPVGGGLDPEMVRTLNADELFKRVEESWAQWDSTNPVAKAAGNWHLSGFDLKKIKVVSGEIIGMAPGAAPGVPSMVLNDYGKGHALYSAIMLGTLYESGPISFEFDTSREGPGLFHVLDAYLRHSGVEPFAQAGLSERAAWKTRIEIPQVDGKGNVFVGITSQNDTPLLSLPVTLRWPAPKPQLLFACVGGSREMKPLTFELKAGKLNVTLPGFDTHASLLALTDSDPLLSLEIAGAPRGIAGLLDVKPGTRLKIKATVWNPSPRKLAAGEVKLFAAPGWFCDKSETAVGTIGAYSSRDVSFEIVAPSLCAKRSLKPIVFKYASGKTTSTPATEMVWWEP